MSPVFKGSEFETFFILFFCSVRSKELFLANRGSWLGGLLSLLFTVHCLFPSRTGDLEKFDCRGVTTRFFILPPCSCRKKSESLCQIFFSNFLLITSVKKVKFCCHKAITEIFSHLYRMNIDDFLAWGLKRKSNTLLRQDLLANQTYSARPNLTFPVFFCRHQSWPKTGEKEKKRAGFFGWGRG